MRVTICISGGATWKVGPMQRVLADHADPDGGRIPFAPELWPFYREVCKRNPAHIVEYGRGLFETLLGEAEWNGIVARAIQAGDRLIELALKWPATETYLSRLHWEMMHDGTQFLAAGVAGPGGKVIDVAITRVVPDTPGEAKGVSALPRVLFVLGSSATDPTLRPGEEVMGILRGDNDTELRISPSVLENASPERLTKRVRDFRPEVVHFICHGQLNLETGSGEIIMKADPNTQKTAFDASQMWQWLSAGAETPQIVILSACHTGTAEAPGLSEQATVAPLAAELVKAGAPVVIGMSGRVSDLACRLFTKRFSEALAGGGMTLVGATAKGRRAAIAGGNAAAQSVDWGFPTVYLSAGVNPQYKPGGDARNPGLRTRIATYALRAKQPAFHGRGEFFQAFGELFLRVEQGAVLAAFAGNRERGYGRTRLLEEFVVQAIRDGNVPCAVLAPETGWSAPKDPMELAVAINRAMETARESLGLDKGIEGPITLLSYLARGTVEYGELETWQQKALRRSGWSQENPSKIAALPVSEAIERQFVDLMAEARQKGRVKERSRAVLLLDELDTYIQAFEPVASERTLGVRGFGTEQEPVPVVLTFSLNTETHDMMKPIAESAKAGWRAMPLKEFSTDKDRREDMRAYARILMNPFNPTLAPNYSDVPWVMDYGITAEDVMAMEENYKVWLKGIPGKIPEAGFFMLAGWASERRFLKKATDREALQVLIAEEGGA